jgi:DNA-binding response OmpR family regulator
MKVLVVDDDLALADVVSFIMHREGYEVILAHDGQMALLRWEKEQPDLIVLDLNLPKLDGLAVCRRIRKVDDTPIIILSVRGQEDDVVEGLRQMIARAEAVLRRAGSQPVSRSTLNVGSIALDLNRNEVQISDNSVISLTRLECRLLEILMRNHTQVVPTDMLIDYIWGPTGGDRVMLKQLIYRLRRKIEPDPSNPIYLETKSNLGYTFTV